MKTLKIVLFIIPFWATGQSEKTQFIHKGILSTYITISPSRMLEFKISNVYLHGNLEYYFDNKISVRGDAFYYVNSLNTAYTVFDFNHNLFFGGGYAPVNIVFPKTRLSFAKLIPGCNEMYGSK